MFVHRLTALDVDVPFLQAQSGGDLADQFEDHALGRQAYVRGLLVPAPCLATLVEGAQHHPRAAGLAVTQPFESWQVESEAQAHLGVFGDLLQEDVTAKAHAFHGEDIEHRP
jgi:hypothetical protein